MKPRRGQSHGWTLTELLVVLALLGVITTWALPQWERARQSAHRFAAQSHLHALAQALAWAQLQQGSPPASLTAEQASPSGLPYRFTLVSASNLGQGLVLQAWPVGPQTQDPCGMLWLDETGQTGNAQAERSSAACWGRGP
jgi:type IV pilus assembly protein PilE